MKKKNVPSIAAKVPQSAGFQVWQISFAWQRGFKKVLDPLGITYPQLILMNSLWMLSKEQLHTHQMDLSQHSGMDPMTTSAVVRILEKKQLLQRKEHPADTRAKTVGLTAEGLRVTRQGVKLMEKFDRQFFGALGAREKTLRNSLQQLVKRLAEE